MLDSESAKADDVLIEMTEGSRFGTPRPQVWNHCWKSFCSIVLVVGVTAFIFTYVLLSSYRTSSFDNSGKLQLYSVHYFFYCFVGGFLSGLSHLFVIPIDIVKCRMQTGEFKSITDGFKRMFLQEAKGSFYRSIRVFSRGITPTILGYCSQGALKFGLYEILKYALGASSRSGTWSVFLFLLASCLAELVADLALAPWEAVKVKIQTSKQSSDSLSYILPLMWQEEGWRAFYKGIVPLWGRQVPMTMMKFSSFEKIVAMLHAVMNSGTSSSPFRGIVVSVLGGILSGILCTVVSHPGDVLVSRLNQKADLKTDDDGDTSLRAVLYSLGWRGLWKGLVARIYMVCCITAFQWCIYDSFKISVGLPTTGLSKTPAKTQ